MKFKIIGIVLFLMISSCVTKKEILYLQDVDEYNKTALNYQDITIQPNDILKISVSALIPETAIPYNKTAPGQNQQNSLEVMKLEGYLVSFDRTITFPVLGLISVEEKTTTALEEYIKKRLNEEGHLLNPSVTIRILNAKVTVLGEVNQPGTYNFTEESITVLQALGYAGDLTIRGVREDVLIIREVDGVRNISHLDLTSANWLESPYYYVKQNDVIIVNPNNPKVKTAGFIGDIGALLALTTVILSSIILITN